jgi:hypothetical protein
MTDIRLLAAQLTPGGISIMRRTFQGPRQAWIVSFRVRSLSMYGQFSPLRSKTP